MRIGRNLHMVCQIFQVFNVVLVLWRRPIRISQVLADQE